MAPGCRHIRSQCPLEAEQHSSASCLLKFFEKLTDAAPLDKVPGVPAAEPDAGTVPEETQRRLEDEEGGISLVATSVPIPDIILPPVVAGMSMVGMQAGRVIEAGVETIFAAQALHRFEKIAESMIPG
jgi:hypothetical protein